MDNVGPFLNERKDYVLAAHVCENAELYDEMAKIMAALITKYARQEELNVEERNLFSIANKNRVGALRASWRSIVADHSGHLIVDRIRQNIETKLVDICGEMNALCTDYLLGDNASNENKLFFYKMVGDYNRYLAEFMKPNDSYCIASGRAYMQATTIAEQNFQPTHPIRLGLALNYSTYFYEIAKDQRRACDTAKKAFDDAISKLDLLDEGSYKDATLIMQLLRDNLTLWTSDIQDDDQGG